MTVSTLSNPPKDTTANGSVTGPDARSLEGSVGGSVAGSVEGSAAPADAPHDPQKIPARAAPQTRQVLTLT